MSPVTNVQQASENERWDLNKYLWSHTNYKTGKTDKPALDYDVLDNWVNLGPENFLSISNDGKYFSYGLTKGSVPTPAFKSAFVKSTAGAWEQEVRPGGFFAGDNKHYIFQDREELCFMELGTSNTRRIKDVAFFIKPAKGKGDWFAYQLKKESTVVLENLVTGKEKRFNNASSVFQFDNSVTWFTCKLNTGELLLFNLATAGELRFPSVVAHVFNVNGKSVALQTTEKTADGNLNGLHFVSLPGGEKKTIWTSADSTVNISGYFLDDSGEQLVLTTGEQKADVVEYSIWFWRQGMDKAVIKVTNQSPGIDAGLMIAGPAMFSSMLSRKNVQTSKNIMFPLQVRPEVLSKIKDPIQVEVWNYKEKTLQSAQAFLQKERAESPRQYYANCNLDNGKVVQLENETESVRVIGSEDFALVARINDGVHGDRFWEYGKDSSWLISLKDGSRRPLPFLGKFVRDYSTSAWFSPGGRYLVYFDANKECNYFSYDLTTGKITNISRGVPSLQMASSDKNVRTTLKPNSPAGIAAWLEGEREMLVYDAFDIWKLDLSGQRPAQNITAGYGRSNQTMFSLMISDRFYSGFDVLREKDTLLLNAFNIQTKYNGYYRKPLESAGKPERLFMGPCFFQSQSGVDGMGQGMRPIKAADANVWIVKKQTATEAPNYFVTTDFKMYRALTDIQPHKNYNWLTTELVSFKQMDGTLCQGVLYKPENFDPSKKYPVIVSFYTHVSDRVYQYPSPKYLRFPLIIDFPSLLVSHGYMVFVPDMHFTPGQWGPSVVNTVDGAARYLKTLPYVDGKRLGATGHSNSGRFGFYLLTHSTSFAAMSVGEGSTNIISAGLGIGLLGDEESMLQWAEEGSTGTGLGELWTNKSTWLDHSAVLHADKTTSPLLLFDNKDGLLRDQAAQLYTALRRLDKKAWWLHYDNGGHALAYPLYLKDFSLRFIQFFDHYLKGAPAPQWMTQGIPYKYKGVESRYELDPGGVCGDNCPVCKKIKTGK
jgi:hypothetical protein